MNHIRGTFCSNTLRNLYSFSVSLSPPFFSHQLESPLSSQRAYILESERRRLIAEGFIFTVCSLGQKSALHLTDMLPSAGLLFTLLSPFLHRCPPGHMTKETSVGKVCVYTLCASRPCRHGTCVAHSPSRYSCHCSEGYRGRHCEVTLAMFHNEDGNSLSLSSMFAISICVMAFLGSYVDYVLFYLW